MGRRTHRQQNPRVLTESNMNNTWQEKSKEAMKADWKMIWQGCLVRDLETDYWTRVIQVYAPNYNDWYFTGVKAALKSHSGSQKDIYLDLTDPATVGCIQREVEKACDYYEFKLEWLKSPTGRGSWNVDITNTAAERSMYSASESMSNEACLGVLALEALDRLRKYEER